MGKFTAGGFAAAMAAFAFASNCMAASHSPSGEYARFAECPLNRATITDCAYSVTTTGSFTIGTIAVPIKNPVTLQGGLEGEAAEVDFYGAEDGDTLSETSQPVRGGLVGAVVPTWWPKFLQDWFNDEIDDGQTDVTATVELAGPRKGLTDIHLSTENLLFEKGTALELPVRFRLESPLFGSNCYIGSEANPVRLALTTATDGSLDGAVGDPSFNDAFSVTTIVGKLVDGSFATPRAEGCGGLFSFFVDSLVNSVLGTPSESGKNSAVLAGRFQTGVAETVKASE